MVHSGYTEGSVNYNMRSRANDMGKVLDVSDSFKVHKMKTISEN